MITIIGAGPVGLHTAKILAKAGKDVVVLEEHPSIGSPVQCTGIVTKSIEKYVKIKKSFLINELNSVELHAPDKTTVNIKVQDLVIDRTKFDKYMAKEAQKAGVNILLNKRVISIKRTKKQKKNIELKIQDKKTKKFKKHETDILIGADGPGSKVAIALGNKKPQFWTGAQAIIRTPVNQNKYQVYFGENIPGFFGWVVPENANFARIGIASKKHTSERFKQFLKKVNNNLDRQNKTKNIEQNKTNEKQKNKIKNIKEQKKTKEKINSKTTKNIQNTFEIMRKQGGLIPKYDPEFIVEKNNMYIVGDAATQVKATTGGGLVPGLKSAEILANSIIGKKSYSVNLASVRRDLNTSLMIRTLLDRFTDKDYNLLIRRINKTNIKKLLNETDRDNPTKMMLNALIKEPRLLLFVKVLLQRQRV